MNRFFVMVLFLSSHNAGATGYWMDHKVPADVVREAESVPDSPLQSSEFAMPFAPASAELTTETMDALVEAVFAAMSQGELESVVLAAWSDREFPAPGTELSQQDRRLAERRIVAARTYLARRFRVPQFIELNMATRTSWWEEFLSPRAASMKKRYTAQMDRQSSARQGGGNPDERTDEQMATIWRYGGPSMLVMVVRTR